ncbi:RDD family protein [Pelagerythrobacter marensis]|uniref:RDD family protein n=1 Tax=Pelagerythrobacter marensis TaxID=543877 RepID=A0A0G3X673_9SPHN|nr:RDD family protein [Pelagerythrobacter marensis]AKM06106.1 RDD family protein [Pelagerythrobacter marensis]
MTAARTAPHLAHRTKRRRDVVTPEGIALPFTVASRSARAGALILDLVIMFVVGLGVTLALVWIAGGLFRGEFAEMSGASEFLAVFWILFWFLLWNGYFMILEMGPRGATLGKRAAGIRVAARGGGRLTPEAVVARNLLRDIELFLPLIFLLNAPSGAMGMAGLAAAAWFLIFVLFPCFNRDALRAGDLIAGTWVVEAPRAKLAGALSAEGAAREGASAVTGAEYRFGDAELSIYGTYELQTLERVLRDDKPETLASVHEAICRKIGWNPGHGDERAFLEAFYSQLRARLEGDMRFGKRKADKFG